MGWGRKHAAADVEVRAADTHVARERSRGNTPNNKTLQDKGEAVTKRADLQQAARNEHRHGWTSNT